MYRKIAFSLVAMLSLSACAGSQGPTKALPPQFIDAVMDAAMAEMISEECRHYRYNTKREEQMLNNYVVRLAAAGYTERDLAVASVKMKHDPALHRKAVGMILDRDIDVDSEASWCRAGKREKARGTNMGKYLV